MPRLDRQRDVLLIDEPGCMTCGKPQAPGSSYCFACAGFQKPKREPKREPQEENATMQELAARELCRRKLLPYVKRFKPDYLAGWFHEDLAARLDRFRQRIERLESPCMLISVPPRHGKTELASKAAPSQWLGLHPEWHIVAATHSGPLAIDNSRDVLDYMRDPKYRVLFPGVSLSRDNQGATGWRTNKKGRYKPVGTDSGVAGYGGNVLIIDDPHKDNEAYSETILDKIWRWYKGSAATRMMPGGGKLIIQTRWGSSDLAGRVLDEEGRIEEGGKWEVVCYPAQATEDEYRTPSGVIVPVGGPDTTLLRKEGEYLHPERYNAEYFEQFKRDPVIWACIFQQNPTGNEAALFKDDMFIEKTSDQLPEDLIYYTAWDTAVALSERNTFNVGITAGVDRDDNMWVVDMIRDRLESDALIDAMIDNFLQYGQDMVGVEKTHLLVAIMPFLSKRLDERRVPNLPIAELLHGNKDKLTRARPIQGRMRQGKVFFLKDKPWYPMLKKEMKEFPGGRFKDIVDAMAWLGQMFEEMRKPRTGKSAASGPRVQRKEKPWRERLKIEAAGARNWRAA